MKKWPRRNFCRAGCLLVGGLALDCVARTDARGASRASIVHYNKREREAVMPKRVKKVTAKVTSVKGECGLGHKVGDVVTFTERGVQGFVCVHALYSLMPKVFAMMYNAEFPWAQDPDVLTHPCPDAVNPVVFELRRSDAE
jgi:uncharacterized repeat protein (TIGR04076 family)